jgi:hypothetical protein
MSSSPRTPDLGWPPIPGKSGDMPIDTTLQTRMWLVPGAQIPDQPQAQIEWLNRWWKQIDDWIDEQQTEPPPPAW